MFLSNLAFSQTSGVCQEFPHEGIPTRGILQWGVPDGGSPMGVPPVVIPTRGMTCANVRGGCLESESQVTSLQSCLDKKAALVLTGYPRDLVFQFTIQKTARSRGYELGV